MGFYFPMFKIVVIFIGSDAIVACIGDTVYRIDRVWIQSAPPNWWCENDLILSDLPDYGDPNCDLYILKGGVLHVAVKIDAPSACVMIQNAESTHTYTVPTPVRAGSTLHNQLSPMDPIDRCPIPTPSEPQPARLPFAPTDENLNDIDNLIEQIETQIEGE